MFLNAINSNVLQGKARTYSHTCRRMKFLARSIFELERAGCHILDAWKRNNIFHLLKLVVWLEETKANYVPSLFLLLFLLELSVRCGPNTKLNVDSTHRMPNGKMPSMQKVTHSVRKWELTTIGFDHVCLFSSIMLEIKFGIKYRVIEAIR